VAYVIAATLITFKIIHLLQAFHVLISHTAVQQLIRFQLRSRVARSLCDSRALLLISKLDFVTFKPADVKTANCPFAVVADPLHCPLVYQFCTRGLCLILQFRSEMSLRVV